jgi:tetratricopeptide (TPR) repeat protein
MRKLFSLVAVTACLCTMTVLPVRAQGIASAKTSDPQRSAELTAQSLALLEKGEDNTDDKARLALYEEGEKLAREAADLDDSNADAHFAIFANMGRRLVIEGAINPFSLLKVNRSLDRCLELNPNHSDALAARGGMYRQLPRILGGNLNKAEENLKRSIELDPQATGARIELARTYHEMGEDQKALPLLQQALYWAEQLNKPRRVREAKKVLADIDGK